MQTLQPPTSWWPSPFGTDDEIGMLNHLTDAKRLQAISLVRSGRLYDLGRVLDERVPVFPGRAFHQTLVTTAHHANMGGVGDNRVNWITEVISGTTQLGTHLDALSHLQIGDRAYNGRRVDDIATPAGVSELGVETVPQIVTRGLLVDVAARGLGPGGVVGLDVPDRSRLRRRSNEQRVRRDHYRQWRRRRHPGLPARPERATRPDPGARRLHQAGDRELGQPRGDHEGPLQDAREMDRQGRAA